MLGLKKEKKEIVGYLLDNIIELDIIYTYSFQTFKSHPVKFPLKITVRKITEVVQVLPSSSWFQR